jgi:hypothetical protein
MCVLALWNNGPHGALRDGCRMIIYCAVIAHFFRISNQDPPAYRKLSECSGRIATLLEKPEIQSQRALLACLDDLLGAIYSLFYAIHHEHDDTRTQALTLPDISNVLVRAKDMTSGKVRTDGKWTAGYYVNSALFRLASVYHRALQIVVGTQGQSFKVLLRGTHAWFKSCQGSVWACSALKKVDDEVNGLKHTPQGIFTGRNVAFDDAVQAAEELLTLLEAFQVRGGKSVSEPTKDERIAAIEHIVYEYANLMSAAFHSLRGPAPMRTHCDDAFLIGHRKLGDFLLVDVRRYGDEIVALDYLPMQSSRSWSLPTWEKTWRAPMNKQLTHLAYARVREPQEWDHRKWVPLLETEFRGAWRTFWEAVTDAEFLAEYERQIQHCQAKQGFAQIKL